MQPRILISGCSFAAGYKFPEEKNNPNIWPNQLSKKLNLALDNLSKTGANNQAIFLNTVESITQKNYDVVIVAWTAIPRYNYHVGLELYETETMLNNIDINTVANNTVSGQYLEKIGNSLRQIHNDHWDTLNVVRYINVLIRMQLNKKIFFVNSLCPWSSQYFKRKNFDRPSELDQYTQNLLSSEARADKDTRELYSMIHNQYAQHGGIQSAHWLNLEHSLYNLKIDTVNNDDCHPGLESQDLFTDMLYNKLMEKL